jgi:hypothetical protein
VITFFSGALIPVFLITVYSKGSRADLTDKEVNDLHALTVELVNSVRAKPVRARF